MAARLNHKSWYIDQLMWDDVRRQLFSPETVEILTNIQNTHVRMDAAESVSPLFWFATSVFIIIPLVAGIVVDLWFRDFFSGAPRDTLSGLVQNVDTLNRIGREVSYTFEHARETMMNNAFSVQEVEVIYNAGLELLVRFSNQYAIAMNAQMVAMDIARDRRMNPASIDFSHVFDENGALGTAFRDHLMTLRFFLESHSYFLDHMHIFAFE